MTSNPAHILIIDDDPMALIVLSHYLNDAGYQTTTAQNGEEALLLLEKYPARFSVILLDRMMEKISGLEVLHQLYMKSTLKMPVIMLTSHAEREDVGAAVRAGVFDFLFKPIDQELLLLVVKRALSAASLSSK